MRYKAPHIKIRISSLQQSYFCIGLLVAAVFAYLYFLNLSVVHVVMRKEAAQQENQLHTEIAMLETSYIDSQHKIADRIATAEGYNVDTNNKVFVTRGSSNLVLRNE
jgi:uncharacterized membrane protein YciS (DUF1049 family)